MAEVSCDSADLLANAKCIDQCVPDGSKMAVLIWLACQIANGGGGGGGGGAQQVFPDHYAGANPGFVPPVPYAVAKDLDAPFTTWFWNPDTAAWE